MRLKACLAAALAALLVLVPLSAMASDDPLADLAQAEADLKAAKAALVGYEGTGVLGFYRHEGATDAVRVLTDPSVTKYQDHIRLDDPDGPTVLSKVRSALGFVEECNRRRGPGRVGGVGHGHGRRRGAGLVLHARRGLGYGQSCQTILGSIRKHR